jgi:beta-galactosidase
VEARRTAFDDRGLTVDDARVPVYSGAMHYWRVPVASWAPCLRAIHDLGLTMVETYVPWRVHEPEKGERAWNDERDLGRFLREARAAGLRVMLRPGPHINAELTSFGMPDWLLADPACQARTARGTPAWLPAAPRAFPIPSYASTTFRAHLRQWYAEVAKVVEPFVGDPVVAIGVDNEAQLFFRTGVFDLDYHPDALAWWRQVSGDAEPPRAWDTNDVARCVRWVQFKDEYIARSLGDFATMLEEAGLGTLARFHNLPPGHHGLYDLRAIQRAIGGPVGIDAYTPRTMFGALRRRAAALVGNASPLPLVLETGIGWVAPLPPLDTSEDPTRERDHLLTLLACGTRGFNLFMAVERDRYYGAAIDARGRIEAHAAWISPVLAALAEVDWPALRRDAKIALVDTRADARFGFASNLLDPLPSVLAEVLDLGPGGGAELGSDAGAIAARRWQDAIARALELAQVPYAIVDECAGEDELARYRAVIVPTLDRCDRALWQRLHALAEAKRAIVVIGPSTPTRDEFDRPLELAAPKRVGRLKAASLADPAGLAADLAALAGDVDEAWQVEGNHEALAFAYRDPSGATRVVFVASDVDRPITARLLADDRARALRDAVTREVIRVEAGRVAIALPARAVRMLVVEPA